MSKTDETFRDAIVTLRAWLNFLDQKERDFREQLDRARRKESDDAPENTVTSEESDSAKAQELNDDAWI